MRILVVEDEDFKYDHVVEGILQYNASFECIRVSDYRSAMRSILTEKWNGVILDMGFPGFASGESYKPEQGLLVLSEMRRKKIGIPVLVYSSSDAYQEKAAKYENVTKYVIAEPSLSFQKEAEEFLQRLS